MGYTIDSKRKGIKQMKKLTGSEKQVAWAEDIRAGYVKVLEVLKETHKIHSDMTQEEVPVRKDPLFPDSDPGTRLVYTSQITNKMLGKLSCASSWQPVADRPTYGVSTNMWIENRRNQLEAEGHPHYDRQAYADMIGETAKALETALETEADARYWIDRR